MSLGRIGSVLVSSLFAAQVACESTPGAPEDAAFGAPSAAEATQENQEEEAMESIDR